MRAASGEAGVAAERGWAMIWPGRGARGTPCWGRACCGAAGAWRSGVPGAICAAGGVGLGLPGATGPGSAGLSRTPGAGGGGVEPEVGEADVCGEAADAGTGALWTGASFNCVGLTGAEAAGRIGNEGEGLGPPAAANGGIKGERSGGASGCGLAASTGVGAGEITGAVAVAVAVAGKATATGDDPVGTTSTALGGASAEDGTIFSAFSAFSAATALGLGVAAGPAAIRATGGCIGPSFSSWSL